MEQTYINDFAEYCMNEYDLQRQTLFLNCKYL